VFIADDDKAGVDSLAELLVHVADVRIAGTANSEMAAADWVNGEQQVWDVLVTDLLLVPGGSGFGLIRHARTLGKFRHVIVYSGFVTEAVAKRCRMLGADAVFTKADLAGLVACIQGLARRSDSAAGPALRPSPAPPPAPAPAARSAPHPHPC
jgi:DNA-binding NarL/FixJ family response regulator